MERGRGARRGKERRGGKEVGRGRCTSLVDVVEPIVG